MRGSRRFRVIVTVTEIIERKDALPEAITVSHVYNQYDATKLELAARSDSWAKELLDATMNNLLTVTLVNLRRFLNGSAKR